MGCLDIKFSEPSIFVHGHLALFGKYRGPYKAPRKDIKESGFRVHKYTISAMVPLNTIIILTHESIL